MSAEEKHHVASAKWCGYSTNLKPTRHYRAVIRQVQWAPSSGREVPCGIIIFFLFLFLNYLIGLLNFILCLYSQVGMFWLENTIGNLERYFPRKCFRINSSNLNFTHMKASLFRLSQFLLYKKFFSPVIILLPNKYFPVLANLGWVLHLYSFTQTLLTSRGPGLVPEPRNQVSAASRDLCLRELVSYGPGSASSPLPRTWGAPLSFLSVVGRLSIGHLFQDLLLSVKNSPTLTQL